MFIEIVNINMEISKINSCIWKDESSFIVGLVHCINTKNIR